MISLKYETEYVLPDYILLEEEYSKSYYEKHPEYNWNQPWYMADFQDYTDFIHAENSPYKLDDEWKIANPKSEIFYDTLLDHYHTDIYAMIPPNYMPLLMHAHTYFELAYVLEGTYINYSGNQELTLKEGDMLILAPDTAHAISAFSGNCRMINVMIKKRILQRYLFQSSVRRRYFILLLRKCFVSVQNQHLYPVPDTG